MVQIKIVMISFKDKLAKYSSMGTEQRHRVPVAIVKEPEYAKIYHDIVKYNENFTIDQLNHSSSERNLGILFLIIDQFPNELLWRIWLKEGLQNLENKETVKIWIHAKFPDKVDSPWVKERIVKTFHFQPKWGSLDLTRAMVGLLHEASTTAPEINKFIFASESCLPIQSLSLTLQSIYSSPIGCTSTASSSSDNILPTTAMTSNIASDIDYTSSYINYTNQPNNGYAKQQQFDILSPSLLPFHTVYKADQWILLSRYHIKRFFHLFFYLLTDSTKQSKQSQQQPLQLQQQLTSHPLFLQLFIWVKASDEMFFPTIFALLGELPSSTTVAATTRADTTATGQLVADLPADLPAETIAVTAAVGGGADVDPDGNGNNAANDNNLPQQLRHEQQQDAFPVPVNTTIVADSTAAAAAAAATTTANTDGSKGGMIYGQQITHANWLGQAHSPIEYTPLQLPALIAQLLRSPTSATYTGGKTSNSSSSSSSNSNSTSSSGSSSGSGYNSNNCSIPVIFVRKCKYDSLLASNNHSSSNSGTSSGSRRGLSIEEKIELVTTTWYEPVYGKEDTEITTTIQVAADQELVVADSNSNSKWSWKEYATSRLTLQQQQYEEQQVAEEQARLDRQRQQQKRRRDDNNDDYYQTGHNSNRSDGRYNYNRDDRRNDHHHNNNYRNNHRNNNDDDHSSNNNNYQRKRGRSRSPNRY